MRRRFLVGLLAIVFALAVPLAVHGDVTVAPGGGTPGTSQSIQLVGHNDLFARGMNAAPALYDHYVYVGNRTDGSLSCSETGGVHCGRRARPALRSASRHHHARAARLAREEAPDDHDLPLQLGHPRLPARNRFHLPLRHQVLRLERPCAPRVHLELRADLAGGPGRQAARDVTCGSTRRTRTALSSGSRRPPPPSTRRGRT